LANLLIRVRTVEEFKEQFNFWICIDWGALQKNVTLSVNCELTDSTAGVAPNAYPEPITN
jgi:hypothetical protein